MWVRGLKQNIYIAVGVCEVAPYVGAWIETNCEIFIVNSAGSHPMWVRGLKLPLDLHVLSSISRTLCGCVD